MVGRTRQQLLIWLGQLPNCMTSYEADIPFHEPEGDLEPLVQ
jgi:hypothetical protein